MANITKTITDSLAAMMESIVPDDVSFASEFRHNPLLEGLPDDEEDFAALAHLYRQFWFNLGTIEDATKRTEPRRNHRQIITQPLELVVMYPWVQPENMLLVESIANDDAARICHTLMTDLTHRTSIEGVMRWSGVIAEHQDLLSADGGSLSKIAIHVNYMRTY